jgi:hypothetical protein
MSELCAVRDFFGKKPGDCLVIGDELGIIKSEFPKSVFVSYSEESVFESGESVKDFGSLDDLSWGDKKYNRIVFLNMMDALIHKQQVQFLRKYLQTAYNALKKTGEILILDRRQYQDDFICQYVMLGAEIGSVSAYGKNHLLLRVLP